MFIYSVWSFLRRHGWLFVWIFLVIVNKSMQEAPAFSHVLGLEKERFGL